MSPNIRAAIERSGIVLRHKEDPLRFKATVPETSDGTRYAISIDLAIKPTTTNLLPYTKMVDSVMAASESLLLIDKIRCLPARSSSQVNKINSDLLDIQYCASQLDYYKATVPEALQELLSEDVWRAFWAKLEELHLEVNVTQIACSPLYDAYRVLRLIHVQSIAMSMNYTIISCRIASFDVSLFWPLDGSCLASKTFGDMRRPSFCIGV